MHDEYNMPDASPDPTSDTPPKKRRFRLRYSLRSLLIFILLVNSACLLWLHWKPWTLQTTLKGHTEQVNNAVFSPDGTRVVTGSHDFTACVWDVINGESVFALEPAIPDMMPGRKSPVNLSWVESTYAGPGFRSLKYLLHAEYSKNGKWIITTTVIDGKDSSQAWDAENGKLQDRLPPSALGKRAMTHPLFPWTRFGACVAEAGHNGTVIISQDLEIPIPGTWKTLYTWRAHESRVLYLQFSNDGKRLVTRGFYGPAKIWRYRHPEQWWGVLFLPAFWATALLSIALAWSLLRDRRILRQ